MNIQTSSNLLAANRSLPSAPKVAAPQIQQAPQDGFEPTKGDDNGGGHFSGGKLLTRMVGGAVNGMACNWLAGGSVGNAALIGGGVGATFGGIMGGVGGAVLGGAAGNPGAGALGGAALGATVGGVSGAVKGAITMALTNALGGGYLAAAGVGAGLSLLF
jgi:hypothetical protein